MTLPCLAPPRLPETCYTEHQDLACFWGSVGCLRGWSLAVNIRPGSLPLFLLSLHHTASAQHATLHHLLFPLPRCGLSAFKMKGTSNNSLLGHFWESPTEESEWHGQDHVGGGTETWGGTTIVVGGVKTALLASVGSCIVTFPTFPVPWWGWVFRFLRSC